MCKECKGSNHAFALFCSVIRAFPLLKFRAQGVSGSHLQPPRYLPDGHAGVLIIDTSLVVSFFMQQVGDMGPTSHIQPPRDPLRASSPFPDAAAAAAAPGTYPFAPPRQAPFFPPAFFPPATPQFLPHHAAWLLLPAFPAVPPVCHNLNGRAALRICLA